MPFVCAPCNDLSGDVCHKATVANYLKQWRKKRGLTLEQLDKLTSRFAATADPHGTLVALVQTFFA